MPSLAEAFLLGHLSCYKIRCQVEQQSSPNLSGAGSSISRWFISQLVISAGCWPRDPISPQRPLYYLSECVWLAVWCLVSPGASNPRGQSRGIMNFMIKFQNHTLSLLLYFMGLRGATLIQAERGLHIGMGTSRQKSLGAISEAQTRKYCFMQYIQSNI